MLAADQTQGAFTLLEQLMRQRSGPPTHVYEREAEGFYILDGELEVTIDGHTATAAAGATIWIPPAHCTPSTSLPASRVLNLSLPGGFDDRLAFFATPAAERTLPPEGFEDHQDAASGQAYQHRIRDLHEETPVGEWVEPGGEQG